MSDDLRDLHVAVGDEHRRADQQRSACTETAAMVGSIFHSRYCRIAIGSVVRPAPTRNRLISRLPKDDDEAEQRAGDDARPDRRQGHAPEGRPRRWRRGSSPPPRRRGSKPARLAVTRRTAQGITISDVAGDERRGRAEDRPARSRSRPRSGRRRSTVPSTTPGTISGISSSVLTAPRPAKRRRADREARRHASASPIRVAAIADLEAEEEAADEALVVGDGAEPAQRVALRREGGDLLPEEGEPDDEARAAAG